MGLISSVFEKLRKHPKRIVFPEGTEPRVLQAAEIYVKEELGVAVLLGKPKEVESAAKASGVSLRRMHVIDPHTAEDLPLFVGQLEMLSRFRGITENDALRIVQHPNYFGAMMLQNGQADGMVAGATSYSGSILRPLFKLIKPLPGVKAISSCMAVELSDKKIGTDGLIIMADCGVIPNPTVDQLAMIAVESAKISRQLSGETPRVAMLSYSTKGSTHTQDTERIVAAAALARAQLIDANLSAEVDGELQVDAAIVPEVAALKAPGSPVAGRANVLVFPDLNSGNIALKLVHRLTEANAYGQILMGLDKPAADLSRGANTNEILGVAAIVGLQAINYRKLYPEQGARYYGNNPLSAA